jgi:hypothetical protein
MRVPILLASSAFFLNSVCAQSLSESDREALLGSLDKLQETVDSRVDAKFRTAISAYRNAIGSDDAAMTLYLNCVEKVNFEDQNRKNSDFRDWKRREAEKLSDGGLRLALRQQLRWLILTLRAASEEADRSELAGEAQDIVDSIFRDSERLSTQEELLGQPVTGSVFARAFEISGIKVENWALSPTALEEIYEKVLLPPYRSSSRVDSLRSGWLKRLQQENQRAQFWDGQGRGQRGATPSPQYAKFLEDTAPRLQWQMEVDLFRNGDENGAAVRMLAHLEKFITHPSARDWSDEFRNLLKPARASTAE